MTAERTDETTEVTDETTGATAAERGRGPRANKQQSGHLEPERSPLFSPSMVVHIRPEGSHTTDRSRVAGRLLA
jgi:hypothetical protein